PLTNKKMRNSRAYKTYLAFATGAATPKKERKFKKLASPLKKRTLITVEEEKPKPAMKVLSSHNPFRKQPTCVVFRYTPGVNVSKKKTQTTIDKSKGIDLLFDVAALEAAWLKKVIKRSKQDTSIHQAGGSGDGTGSKLRVPDEPKGKSDDTNEGTNYVPTDAKMNDEIKDVDEEEYKRISEELSGDINVRLTDADCSISSKFTNAMLNTENLNAGKTKAVSLLDIAVQHEAPHTLPLLTIHVFVITEQIVFNPSDTVTTAPAPTISLLLSSLYLT
nr:hypothetical protein [Tanacetum cinerariifolium]